MLISIDESGDFNIDTDRENFFVSAIIPSSGNHLQAKKEQFTSWKKSIGISNDDEIKGQVLDNQKILSFLTEVVHTHPKIYTSFVSINPKRIDCEMLERHKKLDIIKNTILYEWNQSKGCNSKLINVQKEKVKWLSKRNLNEYMKIYSLKYLLLKSFRETWDICISANFIDEIANITYKIDSDFISNENIHWKSYLKDAVEFYSKEYPIGVSTKLETKGKIQKQYESNDNTFILNKVLAEKLSFYDSKNHFEIQIADILAILPYRKFTQGIDTGMESLFALSMPYYKQSYQEIILDDVNIDLETENFKRKLALVN